MSAVVMAITTFKVTSFALISPINGCLLATTILTRNHRCGQLKSFRPTDKGVDIRNKRQIYLQAGILYWEMYPLKQSIDVYAPGQPMRVFSINDTLDGGEVLPGFTLAVKDLFSE